MPSYAYKALNKSGSEVKASLIADTLPQAKNIIKNQGLLLLEIKIQETTSNSFSFFEQKVSLEELSTFTRQFATLLGAKFQVLEAINTLYQQVEENLTFQKALGTIKKDVSEGISLSKALATYPQIFSSIYVNMVTAGESSGNLDVVLLKLAEFTEAQLKLKNKLKGALTQPLIILVFGFLMVIGIFTGVIPQLAGIFKSSGQSLPFLTQVCLDISDFILQQWYLLIIYIAVAVILIKKYLNSPGGIKMWDQFLLKGPIVGKVSIAIAVERFASTLSTLLSSGVPLLAAMKILKNLMTNSQLKIIVDNAQISVSEGKALYVALSEGGYFPQTFLHMVQLGEKSGELEKLLTITSKVYGDEAENKINGLTAALNPILMVVLGGIVSLVVFAVVMPILNMGNM
jgi:general secretion pathway protein F